MVIRRLLFFNILFLFACVSTTKQTVLKSTTQSAVDKLTILYPVKSYLWTEPLYYVSFHQDSSGMWRIVSVSPNPINNHLVEEERFIVSGDLDYAQPAYTKTNISRSGSTFICKKGGHMSTLHLEESYNGCNSALVKSRFSLENLWGKDIVVALDIDKVRAVFRQTEALEKIKQCKTMKWKWESFRNDIKVTMPVVDESGMYKSGTLAQYTIQSDTLNCMNEITDLRYKVVVTPYKYSPYVIDVKPDKFDLPYNSVGHTVESKIIVEGKGITHLSIGDIYRDRVVGLEFIRAERDFKSLKFYFKLHNGSASYVSVNSVSFYVGEDIFTESKNASYLLPPNSSSNVHVITIRDRTERAIKRIAITLTQNDMKNKKIRLGASIQYEVDGYQYTLYGKKFYPYSRLL